MKVRSQISLSIDHSLTFIFIFIFVFKNFKAEARILDYLQQTNRPYSAIDVFNNLRQEIQKSTVQKALTHLSSQQEIVCKTYGKQQVYVARQDLLEAPSAEDLEALDAQILALKEESVRMKEQLKLQQSSEFKARVEKGGKWMNECLYVVLNELTSSLTDAQIQQRLSDLASEVCFHGHSTHPAWYMNQNTKLEERLVRLRQGVEVIDEEERLSIERLYEEHRKQWRLRKKMVKEMIDLISEGADMKPKVFMVSFHVY